MCKFSRSCPSDPIKYPLQWFFAKTLSWGFGQFFPTGTYTGIGTSVLSLKHVMKSTTKKPSSNIENECKGISFTKNQGAYLPNGPVAHPWVNWRLIIEVG